MKRPDYPTPTSASVTKVMKANRKVDTKPEVRLRSALHRLGYRFRKNYLIVTPERKCRADIVFTKKRVAIFVDGCFWHMCPDHGNMPGGKNAAYWEAKLMGNVERDRATDDALREVGWTVLRVWEHESVEDAVGQVTDALITATRESARHRRTVR